MKSIWNYIVNDQLLADEIEEKKVKVEINLLYYHRWRDFMTRNLCPIAKW